MGETNLVNNPDTLAIVPVPVKRKRGRPRKHPKLDHYHGGYSRAPRDHHPNKRENSQVLTGNQKVNGNKPHHADFDNNVTDSMLGQTVHGVIEASFDAGYLLTVRVSNSETTLRGVVFKAGHYVPVSADNDVAPGVQMIRRNEIPIPRENCVPGQNHNSRSKERNGTVHAARVADSVASKGKQVPSVPTKPIVKSNVANGQPPLVATEFGHAVASKGKQVLNDARPTNGSASATFFHPHNNHPGFEQLLAEVERRQPAPLRSTETDTSSAGKLSADDGNDSDQALSVEPLQTVQPVLHNHPVVLPVPLENHRTEKMSELLQVVQENINENQATQPQHATANPVSKAKEARSQVTEDGEDNGHSKKRSRTSSG